MGTFRMVHWGPALALAVIGTISACTMMCNLQWWPPNTPGAILNVLLYAFWNIATLYNFFTAMYNGPGVTEFGWKPAVKEDELYFQFCSFCEGYKVPRSHHCRKCQRCVMKMDHHCPWINNCVGHKNHGSFSYFLFFAPFGCIQSLFILFPAMYRAINRNYYIFYGTGEEPIVNLGVHGFIACMFAVGLSIGVIFAVGGLFCVQMKSILKNETGIETWIKEKAEYRELEEGEEPFVFPYHLGRWENFRMIFHWTTRPELDGIWWPVKEGCSQYALTIEQIKQKKDKRDKSVVYEIATPYAGSLFPITFGFRVCCYPPCTDESRIAIAVGDRVLVSRWKKHWLYGDKILDRKKLDTGDKSRVKRCRGWFPRKCAVEVIYDDDQVGMDATNPASTLLGGDDELAPGCFPSQPQEHEHEDGPADKKND